MRHKCHVQIEECVPQKSNERKTKRSMEGLCVVWFVWLILWCLTKSWGKPIPLGKIEGGDLWARISPEFRRLFFFAVLLARSHSPETHTPRHPAHTDLVLESLPRASLLLPGTTLQPAALHLHHHPTTLNHRPPSVRIHASPRPPTAFLNDTPCQPAGLAVRRRGVLPSPCQAPGTVRHEQSRGRSLRRHDGPHAFGLTSRHLSFPGPRH